MSIAASDFNRSCKFVRKPGFTLAELLIALAIMGTIATFTIPKVLSTQQDGKWNAMGKEAAGTISAALTAYKLEGSLSSATQPSDLTHYMNYVKLFTGLMDHEQGLTSYDCSSSNRCLLLHNGSVLMWGAASFGGTATTNAIYFIFDPEAGYSGSTNSPGKSAVFFIYYNGRLSEYSTVTPGTTHSLGNYPTGGDPAKKPDWLNWG